jgi:hypothetical protein
MRTLQDLDRATELTLGKATAGKISIGEGTDVCSLQRRAPPV